MDSPDNSNGKDKFGREGAGIFVLARDTGRLLALKRSDNVRSPRTWGIPGGKMEDGETPQQAAIREMQEEIKYKGNDFDLLPLTPYKTKDGIFTFNNFLAVVDHEFMPGLDHETEDFKWVNSLDDWPSPVHHGVDFLRRDKDSQTVIKAEQDCCDPQAEENRAGKNYPPLLYRVTQREVVGDLPIDPRQANDLDPEPYVYASSKLREVLPYLAKNGTRIVNVAMPDSEDFITILPDREEFLKNKKFGGTIVRFSGESFEKSPRKESQWISREGIVVSESNVYDRIESMEDAMHHGLHIVFTTAPMTPENWDFIDGVIKDPSFPHNLSKHIADGTLIYENAVRGVKPSPFLAADGVTQKMSSPSDDNKNKPKGP